MKMTAISLLHLLAVVLLASADHASAPDGAVDSYVIHSMDDAARKSAHDDESSSSTPNSNSNDDAFQKLLDSYTPDTTSTLQQKSAEFHALQSKLDAKLQSIQGVRDVLKYELGSVQSHLGSNTDQSAADTTAPALDSMYDDMDSVGSKMMELIRRTESVLDKVGEYNRLALKGELLDVGAPKAKDDEEDGNVDEDAKHPTVGLQERLDHILTEEMKRRERYNASMTSLLNSSPPEAILESDDDTTTADDNDTTVPTANTTSDPTTTTPPSPYMKLTELSQILSPKNIIASSETTLQKSLGALSNQFMQQHMSADDEMWRSRLAQIPIRYEREFTSMQSEIQKASVEGTCLAIPYAMEIVGRALVEHYHDGTNNVVDVANYEGGGSVVYELTSSPYVPPPRNDAIPGQGGRTRAAYEYEKQRMFDEQMEDMYHQQRSMLHRGPNGEMTLMNQLEEFYERANGWEWYTSFKFEALREYLPEDWERALDTLSYHVGNKQSVLWSEYTPRGAVDAVVPDYVYHSLGVSNDVNFGHVFGRTAGPEVAISAGYSKSGGGGGWTSKPMGHCYPLSMRSEDDPALSLLSRHTHMEGGMEVLDEDVDNSLLVGPKYTVRLPYPVHIDAVTLEHRSFPLSQQQLENGWRGGESAPRWVRVVGFPPCPKEEDDKHSSGTEDGDECGVRGFDITNPIDLGSVEYQRITVTGREDDYGGSDDENDDEESDNSWSGRRRRSIQTFAVNGGKWKPSSLLGEDEDARTMEEEYDSRDPRQCSEESGGSCGAPPEADDEEEDSLPAPGQCAPPKDADSLPSCGADVSSSASSSTASSDPRQIVEAVSFIIEENWGNAEYTCLYRVRVHGDAV